jgi:hypothetical protein
MGYVLGIDPATPARCPRCGQHHAALLRTAISLGVSKAEALRRAICLMEIATEARARGERLVMVDAHGAVVTRIAL